MLALGGSPSRHGRPHEVTEELLLVDGQTTADEPGAHVVTVALQELRPAGVACLLYTSDAADE